MEYFRSHLDLTLLEKKIRNKGLFILFRHIHKNSSRPNPDKNRDPRILAPHICSLQTRKWVQRPVSSLERDQ